MFCPKCGKQIADNSTFCPECGAQCTQNFGQQAQNAANNVFNNTENEFRSAINDVRNGATYTPGTRLKTDRSLIVYILLSIVTCGIYGYYFIYQIASDVNVACAGDGKQTSGLIKFIILSFLTCGIYGWFWQYNLGNRLAENAPRYNLHFQENGTTVLMWDIFGALLCGIGPYIAMNILIKNSNAICAAYNAYNRL